MALQDFIFRIITKAGFTTKGSELTWTELDENFEILVDELSAIQSQSTGNVAPYNPSTLYDNTNPTYVSYGGNIYQYIGASPSLGQTPDTSPSFWQLVSSGALTHAQNTDTLLAQGTSNQVSASDLKAHLLNHSIPVTRSQAIAFSALGQLKPAYAYWIYDAVNPILLVAENEYGFSSTGVGLFENPRYGGGGSMLYVQVNATFGISSAVWNVDSSVWWNEVLTTYPTTGSRIGKMCIFNGYHYVSLTGINTSTNPIGDTTNWALVAVGDSSYIRECDEVVYDINLDVIVSRKDKRGNCVKISSTSSAPLVETFQWGNDNVKYNNIQGICDIGKNQGQFIGNACFNDSNQANILANTGKINGNTFDTSSIGIDNTNEIYRNTFTLLYSGYIVNTGELRNTICQSSIFLTIDNQDQIIDCVFKNMKPSTAISVPSGTQLFPVVCEYDLPTFTTGFNQFYVSRSYTNIERTFTSNSGDDYIDIGSDSLHRHNSTSGTMTIENINFAGDTRLVMIKPDAGNTLTLTYNVGNIYGSGVSDVLVGNSGHFCVGIASATMGGQFIVIYVKN